MGYRMTLENCATFQTRRNQGGAGDASQRRFAPLRHLRHLLIEEGQVTQVERVLSRAHPQHPAAKGRTTPAACRPSARLITEQARQHSTSNAFDHADLHGAPKCSAVEVSGGQERTHDALQSNNLQNPRPGSAATENLCAKPCNHRCDGWQRSNRLLCRAHNLVSIRAITVTRALPIDQRKSVGGHQAIASPVKRAVRPCVGPSCGAAGRVFRRSEATEEVGDARPRARGPGRWRNVDCSRYVADDRQKTGGGVGVGGELARSLIIDIPSLFRGFSEKTCCPPATVIAFKIPAAASRNFWSVLFSGLPGLRESPARFPNVSLFCGGRARKRISESRSGEGTRS